MKTPHQETIGVVGLGYVGLPLAVAFSEKFKVVGYDAFASRVEALQKGIDDTGEVDAARLNPGNLTYTADPNDLADCTFFVVAVPTPLTRSREPDLTCLEESSDMVGRLLKKGDMVVYESTVYPGATEETCLPILEERSGLNLGDFALGYSPERVNPGDKDHGVTSIVKVVSGHDEAALRRCEAVYGSIITAGVHPASSIKTAEAAKVIENVQRDLNIALMNELSKIFARMDINTDEVLAAAATKWNFHRYNPGLVGGHCIGVDPYYLTHRAVQLGYHPEVILSGRRINDSMGLYVADVTIKTLVAAGRLPQESRIWVLGLTFKENVPDFRNTRAVDVVQALREFRADVRVWEPLVSAERISDQFGLPTATFDEVSELDAVVLINGHDAFRPVTLEKLREKMRTPVLVDVKNFFDRDEASRIGFHYRSL